MPGAIAMNLHGPGTIRETNGIITNFTNPNPIWISIILTFVKILWWGRNRDRAYHITPKVFQLILQLILEFWLNRGVDGFRISGIPYFFEDPDLRDEPDLSEPEYTFGLERNVELLYDIRAFVDDWTVVNNSTSKYVSVSSHRPWWKDFSEFLRNYLRFSHFSIFW